MAVCEFSEGCGTRSWAAYMWYIDQSGKKFLGNPLYCRPREGLLLDGLGLHFGV